MESLLRLVALVLVGYAVLCAAVYLLQDRLIFLPRALILQPDGPHVQRASVQRGDVTLRGWIVNAHSPGPLLIYFGGNAEELSSVVDVFARLEASTVLINYRGYGESEGAPSAAALIADARAVVEVMDQRWGNGRALILFGRSIGSGIAAEATRAAQVDALILMSPYRTLTALAKRQVPYLPVDWMLRHRIDATAALASLPPEVLALYGRRDHIIPTEESRAFLRLLNPPARLVEFDAGHNVPLSHPDLWLPIERFVASHSGS